METHRIKLIAFASLFTALTAASLLGCGGWDEQEPPTLDAYLDRLPAKTVGRIFFETAPNQQGDIFPKVTECLRAIAAKVKNEPTAKLVAEVDKLIAAARAARAREQGPAAERPLLPVRDLNLLHDVRDAIEASGADAADYLAWRLDNDATIQPEPKPDPYDGFSRSVPPAPKTVFADLEKRAAQAQGLIRAQWLYLRGAVAFHYGDKEEAQTWFEKVVEEFPAHPRAETALFMKGRCELSDSRSDRYDYEARIGNKNAHDAAVASFKKYTEIYPQGRFVADARGWLGGLSWDEGDYLGALEWYIQQAETPDHPEVLKSAVLMIEKTLRRLAADEDAARREKAFAVIAAHPRVAMGMLYLVLGSPDAAFRFQYPENEKETPAMVTEKIRNWRRTLLPQLASAVAAQKQAYAGDAWQPRYLALLAHAASNTGQHEEALRLVSLARKPEANDDLLFAKAIALQRAGKAPEAITAFRLLLKNFQSHVPHAIAIASNVPESVKREWKYNPNLQSPLEAAARIRLAVALRDNHQAGLALMELKIHQTEQGEQPFGEPFRFLPDYTFSFTDSGIYPDLSNAEPEQVTQLIDTLQYFAPLSELSEAVEKTSDLAFASDLRAIIANRALAREDFQTARQMMTAAQYGLGAAELERLTVEARQPKLKPKEQAERELRVGDAWAAQRNRLADSGELKRRANARALGFKNPDDEMEQSNELVHAWHWWLRAARTAPGTPVAASARLKVLQAMAQLARNSDYFLVRATEDGWGNASRQIYDRLQAECPRSEEAKQAVWWSFELPGRDRENPCNDKFGFGLDEWTDKPGYAGYWWSDYGTLGGYNEASHGDGNAAVWGSTIAPRLNALRTTALDLPALAKEVGALKKLAVDNYDAVSEVACINGLEDLAAFLSEPSITAEAARAYINLRLDVISRSSWGQSWRPPVQVAVSGIPEGADPDTVIRERIAKALKDPQFKDVRDYLEILDAAMVANHQLRTRTGEDDKGVCWDKPWRDYPALERMTRDFLKRYPHSRKREVARLLLARAVFRQSWPRYQSANPSAKDSGSVQPSFQQEPFNSKRVLAPLDDYNKEFPKGRYAADIRNMRAGVLWRSGDWKSALQLTLAQNAEKTPDLKVDTAFRLASLFAELATPEHRPALLAAIRENPASLDLLKRYLAQAPNYRDHPLRFMTGYLQDQLGFKLAPSDEN